MTKLILNRSSKSPRGAVTVTTKSQAIEIDLDETKIIEPIAKTMRDVVALGIRTTTATNARGKKAWNRTGRLASGLTVEKAGERYEVRAPADRLADPKMVEQLAEDVPALARPLDPAPVRQTVEDVADSIVSIRKGPLL